MASPLQDFKSKNSERWTVLQDIPSWEFETIIGWLKNVFIYVDTTSIYTNETFNYGIVRSIETENRLSVVSDFGISTSNWNEMRQSVVTLLQSGKFGGIILFLECLIKYIRESSGGVLFYKHVLSSEDVLIRLEISLERGSKWKVVFDKGAENGLVERVDSRLTQVAQDLANDHLTRAWNEAFAVTPKPDKAIENAQKAIEAVATKKGLISAKTSVYGNFIGDIRSNPGKYISAAKEAFDLSVTINSDTKNPVDYSEQFANWFWTGLDLIQKSNPGRHSSKDTEQFTLKPEAGKQGVLVATLLCELINSGYFTKKETSKTKHAK